MSKRLKRIAKIIEIATMEMDKAAQTLEYMRSQLVADQGQLNSLLDYQQDYVKKPAQSGAISVVQLQAHHSFADKLMQAIVTQKNKVIESEKMLEMAQQAWQEKRVRVKALQALHDRLKNNEQALLNKQEQRFLDELSSQKYAASLAK